MRYLIWPLLLAALICCAASHGAFAADVRVNESLLCKGDDKRVTVVVTGLLPGQTATVDVSGKLSGNVSSGIVTGRKEIVIPCDKVQKFTVTLTVTDATGAVVGGSSAEIAVVECDKHGKISIPVPVGLDLKKAVGAGAKVQFSSDAQWEFIFNPPDMCTSLSFKAVKVACEVVFKDRADNYLPFTINTLSESATADGWQLSGSLVSGSGLLDPTTGEFSADMVVALTLSGGSKSYEFVSQGSVSGSLDYEHNTINLGFGFSSVARVASGLDCKKAYVVNHEVGTVSVVDLGTGKVTTTTPVGSGPYAIAISGNKAYVANYLDSTVSVIDTTTGAVTKTIAVGWGPLAIATSGNKVYVANYYQDNTVSVIDTTTDEVTKTIAVGGGPSNIEISGNKAYVLNHLDGTVSVVDMTTGEVTQTITVESDPEDIAICGSEAYVSNGLSNTVSVINLLTQTVTATVPVGKNACAIAVCGSKAYVANYDDGTVSAIDILTNAVTATIPVGNAPSAIATCGNKAYVTNSGDGTVSVIDTATDTVTATFPAGNGPRAIVFGP
jgi:YVTN family beta-propeller protein